MTDSDAASARLEEQVPVNSYENEMHNIQKDMQQLEVDNSMNMKEVD